MYSHREDRWCGYGYALVIITYWKRLCKYEDETDCQMYNHTCTLIVQGCLKLSKDFMELLRSLPESALRLGVFHGQGCSIARLGYSMVRGVLLLGCGIPWSGVFYC